MTRLNRTESEGSNIHQWGSERENIVASVNEAIERTLLANRVAGIVAVLSSGVMVVSSNSEGLFGTGAAIALMAINEIRLHGQKE